MDLVKEYKSTGTAYRQRVHTVMRSSFASHYRRMIPQLLEVLEFRSNNDIHRPLIKALELLKKYAQSKQRYYDPSCIYMEGTKQNNRVLCNPYVALTSKRTQTR